MRIASAIPALVAASALCACAQPVVSQNAAASGVQAAANQSLASRPTVGDEAAAAAANSIAVEFQPGSAQLSQGADQKLDVAARLFRDVGPVVMFATGYSDPTGDEYSNLLLSARRAQVAKLALVARGIPANRLLIRALGESDLTNQANPDDPENRRVVITWRIL
ncbi:MAG: OmpA family protein [Acetobacteraceae bacterium]|nr:OmpA family protein [Acetobacteraceae bacterium]